MSFRTTLREVRLKRGVTQGAVARMGYVSEPMIQAVEAGRKRLTPDVLRRIAHGLRSPRLAVTYCRACPANLFIPPYLDQVDTHPLAALGAVMDEAREALAAVESLHLRNKRRDADLSPDDRQSLERAVDQVLDLIPAVVMTIAALAEVYGLDPWAAVKRNHEKLGRRGYCEREEGAA
ncbi:MAG: helix-turn-helix transcriptional regulator [Bacillota bacterium]|nr:helix-turn-helix transcriptional regulator [Bacillota bacterium]